MNADVAGQDRAADGPVEPRIEGYRVVRRLGAGGSGVVWLLEDDDGARRAVKIPLMVRHEAAPEGGALLAERWRVQGFAHPHVLRLHGLVPADVPGPDGVLLRTSGVLMDFAPGGSVGRLMAARGTLGPGEVVTLAAPVARALAALHARGIVHGDVSAGNILFSAEGVPLLGDFGQARLTGERRERRATAVFADQDPGEARKAGDIRALAAVAWWCLTGEAPGPARHRPPLPVLRPEVPRELAAVLEEALSEDPGLRPTAGEFARSVQRSAPAVPVQIAAAADPDEYRELATALLPSRSVPAPRRSVTRRSGGRRSTESTRRGGRTARPSRGAAPPASGRPVALIVAGVLGAAALGAAGLGWMGPGWKEPGRLGPEGPSTPPPATAHPVASAPSQDLIAVARRLLAARSAALTDRDAGRLETVYADERLRARDLALIGRLRAEHRHYAGYRPALSAAAVDSAAGKDGGASAGRAVLSVTVTTPSYVIAGDADARPAAGDRRPAQRERLRLTLVLREGDWRIGGVAPRG